LVKPNSAEAPTRSSTFSLGHSLP